MTKRILFVFTVLVAFIQQVYAQKIVLPEWALNPKEGEFVGISLPGGEQREAVCMALYTMLMSSSEHYLSKSNKYHSYKSWMSDYSECFEQQSIYEKVIFYTIKKVEQLPTKETIVLISVGHSISDTVSLIHEKYVSINGNEEERKEDLLMEVAGKCELYVNIENTPEAKITNVKWSKYGDMPRWWCRTNDVIECDGYLGNSGRQYLSECVLLSLLKESPPFIIKSYNFSDSLILNVGMPLFSKCIKSLQFIIEDMVNDWQKKGRYEKTEDYLKRVTVEGRQEYVDSLLSVIKKCYISDVVIRGESTQHIVNYDADNEVFLINDSKYGELLVHVPIEAAPDFEKKFDDVSREDCKYDIVNDRVGLVEAVYKMPDGSKYDYKNDAQLQYAELDINYNFEPIDFNLNIAKSGFADNIGNQSARKKNLTVGLSDVDIEIPVTDRKENNTFVVIIANENYDTESNVDYALNDGNVFKKYCVRILGIPEENISLVENATLNNIRAQIDMLTNIGMAYDGDVKLIFYYAGHGIPDESSKDAYLLPVDGYGNNAATGYKLSELYSQLSGIHSISTIVFLDACFSGADRSDEMLVSARGVAIKTNPEVPDGNLVIFSAAQSDQTAMAYKEKGHGMFTYFLLKKLRETKGNVTLGELEEYITDSVRKLSATPRYNKPQIPAVTVGSSVGSSWRSMRL